MKIDLLAAILTFALSLCACRPEAQWTDKGVEVQISINNVSATLVDCNFSTNKDAYYLIGIEEVRPGYDPMKQQKQYMTLALDSANLEYLSWRYELLKNGEFNIAPFASHSLHYGETDYIFSRLWPDNDYWIYAFAVNPETLEPIGILHLVQVTTAKVSTIDLHFDYRVKDRWDYIYPVDSLGRIVTNFPYIATTRDSLEIASDPVLYDPKPYFIFYMIEQFEKRTANEYFGVKAIENDGVSSHLIFEEGHTYYTFICGFDSSEHQIALYRFVWAGESTDLLFHDQYPDNLFRTENGFWWD